MKYRCVIFDLDGTLVNTLGDIAYSVNKALNLHGFPGLPETAYLSLVGWGMKKLALSALPESSKNEETAGAVALDALRFYTEKPAVYAEPYPGIQQLVAELAHRKVKTAVLSNKSDPIVKLIIDGLFPKGSFNITRGEIAGFPRKPDPASSWDILVQLDCTPSETIFAGDSEIDMETARNAGCFPLGVSWGFRPRNIIEEAGAARIIDEPVQLLEFIHRPRI
jgi:phosphoglycolate phosphatase